MKSLKEREWFFSQDKEKFACKTTIPAYDIYRLKTTRQVICDMRIDSGLALEDEIVIGTIADIHFNYCNQDDREDEELAYTEKCRHWLKNQKSVPAAIGALQAADFCDAAVLLGDVLDYMSGGAAELTKNLIIKKYPEIMMALGGHDITKQMQTGIKDQTSLEYRESYVAEFWPHDIHYYSRVIKEKVVAVILNNSRSCYLDLQVEKLREDIEAARRSGRIIIIFQHEPVVANSIEEAVKPAIIDNGSGKSGVCNFRNPIVIGEHMGGATAQVYKLITENADVIKAVVAGHWHDQYYGEIEASYEKGGERIPALIPHYILSGNPYHEAGLLGRLIIK